MFLLNKELVGASSVPLPICFQIKFLVSNACTLYLYFFDIMKLYRIPVVLHYHAPLAVIAYEKFHESLEFFITSYTTLTWKQRNFKLSTNYVHWNNYKIKGVLDGVLIAQANVLLKLSLEDFLIFSLICSISTVKLYWKVLLSFIIGCLSLFSWSVENLILLSKNITPPFRAPHLSEIRRISQPRLGHSVSLTFL